MYGYNFILFKNELLYILSLIYLYVFERDALLRVRIKRIAIAKWDIFFYYCDAREIPLYYFGDTKLFAKREKAHVNSIYFVGIMSVR